VVVYSKLGRDRLLAQPGSGCVEWVALWNDHGTAARETAGAKQVAQLGGPHSVTVWRRACQR